ncbi:MAG: acetyl-CoA carboxylase carboxyltransferase subunit alpha [Bacillota bacterium]
MTTAWDRVLIARSILRPTSKFFIEQIFDGFIELKGDRNYADDAAIIGGIAWLGETAVTVIAEEKGADVPEKVARNFGCPHPEGYRKSLRLMEQAEKFNRPIVCLVDTQGAYCGIGAEERGQGHAIATNLERMMTLTVPIISIVIGEGGSGGALALAVADKVAMLENAIYSILSPEGFSSILWKDSSRAKEAAEVMKITANDLMGLGIIDDIIKEPVGGAQNGPEQVAETMKKYLLSNFEMLSKIETSKLLDERYQKYRRIK